MGVDGRCAGGARAADRAARIHRDGAGSGSRPVGVDAVGAAGVDRAARVGGDGEAAAARGGVDDARGPGDRQRASPGDLDVAAGGGDAVAGRGVVAGDLDRGGVEDIDALGGGDVAAEGQAVGDAEHLHLTGPADPLAERRIGPYATQRLIEFQHTAASQGDTRGRAQAMGRAGEQGAVDGSGPVIGVGAGQDLRPTGDRELAARPGNDAREGSGRRREGQLVAAQDHLAGGIPRQALQRLVGSEIELAAVVDGHPARGGEDRAVGRPQHDFRAVDGGAAGVGFVHVQRQRAAAGDVADLQ